MRIWFSLVFLTNVYFHFSVDEEVVEIVDPIITTRLPETVAAINNKSETRKSKKKAGLLRGLGSMFRFGKHRKPAANSELAAEALILPPSACSERRSSGPPSAVRSEVDRYNVLRRTLPPDDRDRAELSRQMAMAAARQVICRLFGYVLHCWITFGSI